MLQVEKKKKKEDNYRKRNEVFLNVLKGFGSGINKRKIHFKISGILKKLSRKDLMNFKEKEQHI